MTPRDEEEHFNKMWAGATPCGTEDEVSDEWLRAFDVGCGRDDYITGLFGA